MSCKEYVEFKPGDDIYWAGVLEQPNITDYTGYELAVEFRAKNRNNGEPDTLLGSGTVTWTDVLTGAFLIQVPRATTADWPVGITIVMDVSVLHPSGHRVRSETLQIKTVHGVTEDI